MKPNQPKFVGPKPPGFSSQSKEVDTSSAEHAFAADLKKEMSASVTTEASTKEEVTIQTMKDDLASIKHSTQTTQNAYQAHEASSSTPSSQPSPAALPNIPAPVANGKSLVLPKQTKSKPRSLRVAVSILIALVLIGGGGTLVWYFFGNESLIAPINETKEASAMIPASATSVIEYQLAGDRKTYVNTLWTQPNIPPPTFDTLLAGDPRLLLVHDDVTSIYYVQLANEPRPFLLVPQSQSTDSLFQTTPSTQYIEINGWYIVHPVNPGTYETALVSGTMKERGLMYEFTVDSTVRLYLSQTVLEELGLTITGLDTKEDSLAHITVKTDLQGIQSNIIAFDGVGERQVPAETILKTNPALLRFLPEQTTFAFAGYDVAGTAQANNHILDEATINQPAVRQLVASFKDQPYIFYRHNQESIGTSQDINLVITIPPSLKETLAIGDKTLEAALFSLAPMITGNKNSIPALAFSDGVYQEVPLRYVNIAGTSQALDYALVDSYLLISSSKSGMLALIDNIKEKTTTRLLNQVSLQPIQELISANPDSQQIVIARIEESGLRRLFPGLALPGFGHLALMFSTIDNETKAISGLVTLPTQAQ